ncbi:unnamed protein product [Larinioides sclopetarius]|uniref:Uncharacterized protein n=1 Tax=Larinioides sclopetarius TaxID=280406 RepID=A0AAV2A6T5_9ARAC
MDSYGIQNVLEVVQLIVVSSLEPVEKEKFGDKDNWCCKKNLEIEIGVQRLLKRKFWQKCT